MKTKIIKKLPFLKMEDVMHRVKNGETIQSIAKKYNQSVNHLKAINYITGELYVGQLLYIDRVNKMIYTVKPADTINSLSQKFDVPISHIMELNNINQVFIGQQIFL